MSTADLWPVLFIHPGKKGASAFSGIRHVKLVLPGSTETEPPLPPSLGTEGKAIRDLCHGPGAVQSLEPEREALPHG